MSVSGKALELSLSSLIRTWALVCCCKSAIFLWYTNVWLVSICPSQSRAEIDLILHWRQRRFPTTPGRLLLCSIPSNGQLQVRDRYKAGRPVISTTFWLPRSQNLYLYCSELTADGVIGRSIVSLKLLMEWLHSMTVSLVKLAANLAGYCSELTRQQGQSQTYRQSHTRLNSPSSQNHPIQMQKQTCSCLTTRTERRWLCRLDRVRSDQRRERQYAMQQEKFNSACTLLGHSCW